MGSWVSLRRVRAHVIRVADNVCGLAAAQVPTVWGWCGWCGRRSPSGAQRVGTCAGARDREQGTGTENRLQRPEISNGWEPVSEQGLERVGPCVGSGAESIRRVEVADGVFPGAHSRCELTLFGLRTTSVGSPQHRFPLSGAGVADAVAGAPVEHRGWEPVPEQELDTSPQSATAPHCPRTVA